ncbi:hypothetical protein [Streptomyces sp. NPDC088789]|uniref:hypothetical protein n=1 Tax=Streptomyces sp. NPDC088789 TaxID=3365899 RepID=UPI00381363DA
MPTPPEAHERRIRGAGAVMPVALAALMPAHIKDDSDPSDSAPYALRCPLEAHGSGPHHALTRVLDDRCGLFARHPGGHSFEFADPVREAFERSPQYRRVMAAVDERTRRAEPDPPDHATGRQGPTKGWAPPA